MRARILFVAALALLISGSGCSPHQVSKARREVKVKVARTTDWRSSEIASPAGIRDAVFRGIGCFNSHHCVALGQQTNNRETAFAITEARGKWRRAVMLRAPARTRDWTVTDISCPSARLCVVVGELQFEGASPTSAFVGTLAGRQWSGPQLIRTATLLNAVSCQAPGSCVAVGESSSRPVTVTESAGRWHKAIPVNLAQVKPSGDFQNTLVSVACDQPGFCVAVGSYSKQLPAGLTARPMIVVSLHGTWLPARTVVAPKGINAWPTFANALQPGSGPVGIAGLDAVSCLPGGLCLAVGGYLTSQVRWSGISADVLNGHIGRSQGELPSLSAITCDSRGCVGLASADARSGSGKSGDVAITYSGGHWHSAMPIKPPANANTSPQMSPLTLRDIACFPNGGCIAVGDYQTDETIPSHRLLVATRP